MLNLQTNDSSVIRLRRNRKNTLIRNLFRENSFDVTKLISPLFVLDGTKKKFSIPSMPEYCCFSIDYILKEVELLLKLGINNVILFPKIENSLKNNNGTEAINPDNLINRTIKALRHTFAEQCTIIVDIALDPFTIHGHDAMIDAQGNILNDETNIILAQQSINYAKSGCDVVAPSDMMDGRIKVIRSALEKSNLVDTLIFSYSSKYASVLYSPFRDLISSRQHNPIDKKNYQLSPFNTQEAIRESKQDIKEGADALIIKPATMYQDIIRKNADMLNFPLIAYQVSGTYAMIRNAIKHKIINDSIIFESIIALKRSGANAVISYFSKYIAKNIHRFDDFI